MTYLEDLVDAFKREVSIPGTFSTDYPVTTDDDIELSLGDGFAMAQLDGFFPTFSLDVDTSEITPDLSNAGAALVVLYSGIRLIRQKLRGMGLNRRYKAGPVEVEMSTAVSLLVQELKDLQKRLDNLKDQTSRVHRPTAVFMIDGYVARQNALGYGGFATYELPTGVSAVARATGEVGVAASKWN